MKNTIFYVVTVPHEIEGVKGTLAICFNEQQKKDLHESRYDEIIAAQKLLEKHKSIKAGLEKYFNSTGVLLEDKVKDAGEFDGYSCIFLTTEISKEDLVHYYFEKVVK